MARLRRLNRIPEQFVARTISMLRSPAYCALSRAAHQIMARLEIEHLQHGGCENGALPVTFDHFVEHGAHRHAVAPAIRELEALGFVEVTRRGSALNGRFRQPSLYRLTYVRAKSSEGDGTHEWRAIKTLADAERIADQARREANLRAKSLGRARAQKQKASAGFRHPPVPKTGTGEPSPPVPVSVTPHQCRKPARPLYLGRVPSIDDDGAGQSAATLAVATAAAPPGAPADAPPAQPQPNGSAALMPAGSSGPVSIHVPRPTPAALLQTRRDEARAKERAELERRRALARKPAEETKH